MGFQSFNSSTETSNFSYSLCVGLMFLDAVLYGVIAWYLDKILPSEFGTSLPYYFPLLPSYWCGMNLSSHDISTDVSPLLLNESFHGGLKPNPVAGGDEPMAEPISAEMEKQIEDGRAVRIRGLRKVFEAQRGSERVAVNGLNLEMFEGQVTVLLGHNGAGKSTTINMLVGLTPPTAGDALMCGDLCVSRDMQAIRRQLGVCPQHDILFAELTPMQHLQMFASFKGVASRDINAEAQRMVT